MARTPAAMPARWQPAPLRGGRAVTSLGRPPEWAPAATPPLSNARIAVVMLLVAEVMFFSGLIGAYLVFRVGSPVWPPPDQPRLPLAVTWANTLVLMASGVTMVRALHAVRRDDRHGLRRGVAISAALGTLFVAVQGAEWVRLIHHGLTLSAGTYGATFYALIGAHAAHVAGAVAWLGMVWHWARRGRIRIGHDDALEACVIYWVFVCALWLVLFALVYR